MRVLITGGTGTVGKSLIRLNDNEYINVSRNEEKIAELKFKLDLGEKTDYSKVQRGE